MSLLLLLYCPSLYVFLFFVQRAEFMVYARGLHLISISLLLSVGVLSMDELVIAVVPS